MQKNNKNQSTVFGLVLNLIGSLFTNASNFVYVIIAVILIGLLLKPRKINLLPPIPNIEHMERSYFLYTDQFMKRVRSVLPDRVTNIWLDESEHMLNVGILSRMEDYFYGEFCIWPDYDLDEAEFNRQREENIKTAEIFEKQIDLLREKVSKKSYCHLEYWPYTTDKQRAMDGFSNPFGEESDQPLREEFKRVHPWFDFENDYDCELLQEELEVDVF